MYNVTVKNGLTTQKIECDTLTEIYNLEAKENLEILDYEWVEE